MLCLEVNTADVLGVSISGGPGILCAPFDLESSIRIWWTRKLHVYTFSGRRSFKLYTQETQHIFRPDYHQILSTFPILGEVFFPTPKTKVTALHRAAQFGLLDVAQILLDANAEVDVTSEEGFTPLMLAARTGQSYSAWKTKTKMTMGISPFLNKRYIFKLLCFYCHFGLLFFLVAAVSP